LRVLKNRISSTEFWHIYEIRNALTPFRRYWLHHQEHHQRHCLFSLEAKVQPQGQVNSEVTDIFWPRLQRAAVQG
jgi:hypothetical protein